MIRAHLHLVVKIARDYENLGLSLLNLIYEGTLGLLKAMEHFDPDKGVGFSDWSLVVIESTIRQALARLCSTLRLLGKAADWPRTTGQGDRPASR